MAVIGEEQMPMQNGSKAGRQGNMTRHRRWHAHLSTVTMTAPYLASARQQSRRCGGMVTGHRLGVQQYHG